MFTDVVEFTLPAGYTPETAIGAFAYAVKAVEFTRAGATVQAGFVTNFRVATHNDSSTALRATLYADSTLDYATTFTVSGWSGGTLTVAAITKPQYLPLFF